MRIAKVVVASTLLVGTSAVMLSCTKDATEPQLDPNGVAYSFAVLGCNRVAAPESLGVVSTANVPQLNRTFADIAAMSPKPNFLFFAGDLVFGYTNDSTALDRELKGWIALYQASPLANSGVELVTVPGNHETDNLAKVAVPSGERVWLRDMAAYIGRGGNGPAAGGADGLQTDQSKLTYSFDFKDAHFVLLNTDPVGKDWHVPTAWVTSDLAAARGRGAKHIFAIAHKPAYSYPTLATDGLSFDVAARDAFWNVLANNQVEGMFSAHNHMYWRAQPTGKTWQVIAGNGGSPLDAAVDVSIPGTGAYFGFTIVTVTNSGRVFSKSYGRDIPAAGYAATAPGVPATLRDSFEITWK
ncbi:MAG TPA: metallophosphoesterase [Gemmatimonadaceae bacterium]|nr:metallophosphoesterase [Gemmatimonadaceae bacterium]